MAVPIQHRKRPCHTPPEATYTPPEPNLQGKYGTHARQLFPAYTRIVAKALKLEKSEKIHLKVSLLSTDTPIYTRSLLTTTGRSQFTVGLARLRKKGSKGLPVTRN